MPDPTGGAAKIAEEMAKEVQSATQQADVQAQKPDPSIQFNEVLDSQKTASVQNAQTQPDIMKLLQAAREAQQQVRVPSIGTDLNSKPAMSGLQRVMEDVMQGQNKLEEIINLSMSGRNFSSSELLALQAGVYRFTQELELTSKVIEKGTAAVKQTMSTQV